MNTFTMTGIPLQDLYLIGLEGDLSYTVIKLEAGDGVAITLIKEKVMEDLFRLITRSRTTKTVFKSLLTLAGLLAIVQGWKQYNENLPKPTEEDQVTRLDYMSGKYEEDLKKRQEQKDRNRNRGRFFVVLGTSLVASGSYLLYQYFRGSQNGESDRQYSDSPKRAAG